MLFGNFVKEQNPRVHTANYNFRIRYHSESSLVILDYIPEYCKSSFYLYLRMDHRKVQELELQFCLNGLNDKKNLLISESMLIMSGGIMNSMSKLSLLNIMLDLAY